MKASINLVHVAEFSITSYKLTLREVECLGLVAFGCSNYQIAKVLHVSVATVKKILEKIFYKLQACNRTNAIAIAFIHRILNMSVLTDIIKTYNIQNRGFYID